MQCCNAVGPHLRISKKCAVLVRFQGWAHHHHRQWSLPLRRLCCMPAPPPRRRALPRTLRRRKPEGGGGRAGGREKTRGASGRLWGRGSIRYAPLSEAAALKGSGGLERRHAFNKKNDVQNENPFFRCSHSTSFDLIVNNPQCCRPENEEKEHEDYVFSRR